LPAAEKAIAPRPFGTFSIAAYDEKTGDLGVAVPPSSSPSAASAG